MMRWAAAVIVLAFVAGCGSKLENENCSKSTSSAFEGEEGDCGDGLVCLVADDCTGTCDGTCRKLCNADADCSGGATCTGEASPENGGGKYCHKAP